MGKDRRCGDVHSTRELSTTFSGYSSDEEQVGRFAVGDLGKMSLYPDKKENLANCFRLTKGRRTSRSGTLPEFDVSGGMPW